MKFIIDGETYDADDIGEVSGQDMLAMSKQADMGIQTWQRTISQIPRLATADDGSIVVLSESEAKATPERCDSNLVTESEPHLRAFLVMVWLARRIAGNRSLTFAESASLPFRKIDFVSDATDAEPEPETVEDPTPPVASAPDAAGEAPTSTPSSTA